MTKKLEIKNLTNEQATKLLMKGITLGEFEEMSAEEQKEALAEEKKNTLEKISLVTLSNQQIKKIMDLGLSLGSFDTMSAKEQHEIVNSKKKIEPATASISEDEISVVVGVSDYVTYESMVEAAEKAGLKVEDVAISGKRHQLTLIARDDDSADALDFLMTIFLDEGRIDFADIEEGFSKEDFEEVFYSSFINVFKNRNEITAFKEDVVDTTFVNDLAVDFESRIELKIKDEYGYSETYLCFPRIENDLRKAISDNLKSIRNAERRKEEYKKAGETARKGLHIAFDFFDSVVEEAKIFSGERKARKENAKEERKAQRDMAYNRNRDESATIASEEYRACNNRKARNERRREQTERRYNR